MFFFGGRSFFCGLPLLGDKVSLFSFLFLVSFVGV